jgi:hypothetical protein
MSKIVVIGGDTSTGKSTSCGRVDMPEMKIDIKGLNPEVTYLFNVMAGKPLSSSFMAANYSKANKNLLESSSYDVIKAVVTKITEGVKYKNIIIDDFQYLMSLDYFSKKDQDGFKKYAVMGFAVVDLLLNAMATRPDLIIYLLTHTDEEISDGKTKVKLKTIGKMLDDTFKLAGMFTILLESYKKWDPLARKMEFGFRVRPDSEYSIAKAPIDMFVKDGKHLATISNDLSIVEDEIRKTYNI